MMLPHFRSDFVCCPVRPGYVKVKVVSKVIWQKIALPSSLDFVCFVSQFVVGT